MAIARNRVVIDRSRVMGTARSPATAIGHLSVETGRSPETAINGRRSEIVRNRGMMGGLGKTTSRRRGRIRRIGRISKETMEMAAVESST